MVDFWRFSAGIALGSCLSQIPIEAWGMPHMPQVKSFDAPIEVQFPKYLVTSDRLGDKKQFFISNQATEFQPSIPIDKIEVIEVIADRQEYKNDGQTILAEGNVVLRFAQSVLSSDRLEVNLEDRIAVATGNVSLKRGEQVLRGEKFEYYLVADRGVIFNAAGEIFQPSLSQDTDLERELANDRNILDRALSDRLQGSQPISNVATTGGFNTSFGSSRDARIIGGENTTGGTINRLRFEAERIDFEGSDWVATNLTLTNDPFSPPELEVRADTATFQRGDSGNNRLTTRKSRLVLDDTIGVPLLVSSFAFDNRPRNPGLFNLAFDGEERGGLFIERSFNILQSDRAQWSITPQYFLQRALFPTAFNINESDEGGAFDPGVFGVKNRINIAIAPRTNFSNSFTLTSFDDSEIEENFRSKTRLQQTVGKPQNPYQFALEYNYRDRLFNGSLGFQDVRSSIGGVIISPNIAIGKTGINFNYQASIQNINADTDRLDLLPVERNNDRINLTRYQGAIFVRKNFSLWSGKPLPSTKKKGLRYTPSPVVPYLELTTGINGVTSFYSNGEQQPSLEGAIGFQGQLGHFSRSWLDYTGFKVRYSQNLRGDESPFLFDRLVDRRTLELGISQQLYGPIRLGINTSLDLENSSNEISTDYTLEYSRRTYGITLRYNPVLELGSFSFRINDFNWQGNPQPFRDEITVQ